MLFRALSRLRKNPGVDETDALAAATDPINEKLETVSLKPTKANIAVKLVALAWTPHWRDGTGALLSAWD